MYIAVRRYQIIAGSMDVVAQRAVKGFVPLIPTGYTTRLHS
jgi:hypothetical protein